MLSADQQWIKDTLAHTPSCRVPFHFDFTPPARDKLADYFGSTEIADQLELPIRWGAPKSIKPLYADVATYGSRLKDEFGVTWLTSDRDRGAPLPCLTAPDLGDYVFPDPGASYRFQDLPEWSRKNRDHYRLVWCGDLWERATFMRGMEDLLTDTVTHRNFVHSLLRSITDYILSTMDTLSRLCDFEAFSLSDDYGTQKDLLLSPEDWRDLIKPLLFEISDKAAGYGKDLMIHSCGNISRIVGDLIEVGFDIIHPIQPETMDIFSLKEEYGNLVTFQGGISTQHLLPQGSPEEIQSEIRELKERMGAQGGYILEPGITLQGDIPLENLLAMFEAAQSP